MPPKLCHFMLKKRKPAAGEKEARRRRKIFLSFNSVKMAVQLCFSSAHFHTLPYFYNHIMLDYACEHPTPSGIKRLCLSMLKSDSRPPIMLVFNAGIKSMSLVCFFPNFDNSLTTTECATYLAYTDSECNNSLS